MYLKNLNDENSQICNRIENKQWLDENMEKYKVKAMYSLQPPYDIKEYYGNNDDKLDMLKEFIMQAIKFPVPNRSEYIPSPYEPDADGVLDIGYYKGSIIGGRPYVLECWQMDELVVATVFFQTRAGCL